MITFILNFLLTALLACLLNFSFSEKRQYRKLKILNAELDILLKAAEAKEKNIQPPEHIQLFIKQLYEKQEKR